MELVVDKVGFIKTNLRGPSVLDVGFLGHTAEGFETCPTHKSIVGTLYGFRKVYGLDLEWAEIREARITGWDSHYTAGDACEMPFRDKPFSTIVAADLIEHLENPGLFLDECRRVLMRYGRLIITTPNPYYIDNWLYIWLKNSPLLNPDHKSALCPVTLSRLVAWKGFKIVDKAWLKGSWNLGGFISHRKDRRYDHMTGRWIGKALPGERHLLAILRALWLPLRWLLTRCSPLTRHSDYAIVCERV
jgi:SAM-dependent methyltransferase